MSKALSVALAGLVGVLATGCAQEEESLIVLNAPLWTQGMCKIQASGGSTSMQLSSGTLDLAFATPYTMPVLVQNRLLNQPQMTQNSGIADGELQLTGADVTLSMPSTPEVIDALEAKDPSLVDFSPPVATISIEAGARAPVMVDIIPQGTAVALAEEITSQLAADARPTIVAEVVFRARRTGNKIGSVGEFEARPFSFPVELCTGCLLQCGGCDDQALCTLNYGGGGVCGNAQDFEVYPPRCTAP